LLDRRKKQIETKKITGEKRTQDDEDFLKEYSNMVKKEEKERDERDGAYEDDSNLLLN
jgi:hypothetical protein